MPNGSQISHLKTRSISHVLASPDPGNLTGQGFTTPILEGIMKKIFDFIKTPFVGSRFGPSMGLVFLILFLSYSFWEWTHGRETPGHVHEITLFLIAFVLLGKVISMIGRIKLADPKEEEPEPELPKPVAEPDV
jgi:hypothetical protein